LEITKETLETFNYRVITAENGAEALALYQSQAGNISEVITDIMMPIMGGEVLVRELRKVHPEVKVICVTGLEIATDSTSIAQLEPNAFLTKPYSTEKLLNMLREVLGS
jgi:CheY-like chemotaxis protein